MAGDCVYSVEKISDSVYCISENNNLLMYVVDGDEKCALIDTGSGGGNLYDFVQNTFDLIKNNKKLIVINTHNHAEQTGANWQFSSNGKTGKAHCVEDLCVSGADKTYTRLLDSSFDWSVKGYKVTKWLKNGEFIKLGKGQNLIVKYTPGHTPDSIVILYPADDRIFLGDTFHQFDDVLLTSERSSIKQLIQSLALIIRCVSDSSTKRMMRYSASKNDKNELCMPVLKNYQRFLFAIVAGVQREIPLRVDEHNGSRFESRDKLIKVVLSRTIISQLKTAQYAVSHCDSSIHSSSTPESGSILE